MAVQQLSVPLCAVPSDRALRTLQGSLTALTLLTQGTLTTPAVVLGAPTAHGSSHRPWVAAPVTCGSSLPLLQGRRLPVLLCSAAGLPP